MTDENGVKSDTRLRVTILGCSGTYSSSESSCSAYLVQTDTTTVLLDAGAGSSIELQRHVDLAEIDAIVVSHEHPDHWTELPTLHHGFRWGIGRFQVPTYGTAGTRELLAAALPVSLEESFDWTDISPQSTLTIGDQHWTFSLTDHPVETLATRIESGGAALVYSADTGPDWSPTDFGAPIDLMVYEASLPVDLENHGIPHVSGREAGARASAAGVGKLVITHVPPGHSPAERKAAAEDAFGSEVEVAAPGRTFYV